LRWDWMRMKSGLLLELSEENRDRGVKKFRDMPSGSPTPPSTPCRTSRAAQVIICVVSIQSRSK